MTPQPATSTRSRYSRLFDDLLRGYRFHVCLRPSEVASALAVRTRVYAEECDYDVPIPDEYDDRSWFLIAKDAASGEAVGSLRITPRSLGPLEAEEYFDLPPFLAARETVEMSRFAIVPSRRDVGRFLPTVALGLFKLAGKVVDQLQAEYIVICSRPERTLTYRWLRFEFAGQQRPYLKLGGTLHDLMICDVRGGARRHSDHRYWDCFYAVQHAEIEVPDDLSRLGVACRTPASMRKQVGRA
jgi:N-acyl-L-homoserine lactone synthetase